MEDDLWWKTTFDGRRTLMEDDLWWKMIFDGRQPLMEDNLWWKTVFDGRRPFIEDDFLGKITFEERQPLMEDEGDLVIWRHTKFTQIFFLKQKFLTDPIFFGPKIFFPTQNFHPTQKNTAKRSRHHARKTYREYTQRRVCFINVPVPWPHSNINIKFCTSRLCMKMLSFLFVHA